MKLPTCCLLMVGCLVLGCTNASIQSESPSRSGRAAVIEERSLRNGEDSKCIIVAATEEVTPGVAASLRGPVLRSFHIPLENGKTGLLVDLDVGSRFPTVYLGPLDFLELNQMTVEVTNEIEITGYRATINNRDVIIAQTLTLRDKTVRLRSVSSPRSESELARS